MTARSSGEPRSGRLTAIIGRTLIGLIVFAPAAFAGTRPWAWLTLCGGLHFVFGFWLLSLWVEQRRPRIASGVCWAGGLLLGYVWLRFFFLPLPGIEPFTQAHFARIAERWPESILWRTPWRITLLVSALIAAFLVSADLTASRRWRLRFAKAIVATGVFVVLLGFLENRSNATGIYWETPVRSMPSKFFGTFYHFTSAGAFINLTWPLAATLAVYSWQRYRNEGTARLAAWTWTALALLLLLGHTAHISKYPQVLGAAGLLILFAILRPWRLIAWSRRTGGILLLTGLAFTLIAGFVIEKSGRLQTIENRWKILQILPQSTVYDPPPPRSEWGRRMRDDLIVPYHHENYFLRDRGAAYAFAWKVFLRRPLLGFGPGGWIAAVSEYATDPVIGTFYLYLQFTHEDFLQTLVEWGLLGVALALFLVATALKNGLRTLLPGSGARGEKFPDDTQAVTLGALIAIFAVLMQALVDFPLQIPANALYASVLLAMCCSGPSASAKPGARLSVRHGQ